MANRITTTELDSIKNKISLKTFVRDFPRTLNLVITTIINLISQFYDTDTDTLKAQKANIDYINATTIAAKNINFKGNNGEVLSYDDLVDEVAYLRQRIDNITLITKQQIDLLNGEAYPEQTISVGSSVALSYTISNPNSFTSYDTRIVTVTNQGTITGITEGYTLVSASNSLQSEIIYVHVTQQ